MNMSTLKKLISTMVLVGLVFLPSIPLQAEVAKQDLTQVRLGTLEVNDNTVFEPFEAYHAFKVVLAAYRTKIERVKKDRTLDEKAREEKVNELESQVENLLVLQDKINNISPLVFAISIQFGAEIPFGFTKAVWRVGENSTQGSAGVTFAMTRNQLGQSVGIKNLVVGASFIVGGALSTVGKDPGTGRTKNSDMSTFLPAVAVIVPMNEKVRSKKVGDLQGAFYGIGAELTGDAGNLANVVRIAGGGFYIKPNSESTLTFPEVGLGFLYTGKGGDGKKGQLEALYFANLWSSDGSLLSAPFLSDALDVHTKETRMQGYDPQGFIEAMLEAQGELTLDINELPNGVAEEAQEAIEQLPVPQGEDATLPSPSDEVLGEDASSDDQ